MASHYATDIMAYLIKKGSEAGKPLTQLQLQKLIVIAHGYYLALFDEPLIHESVEAWQYGPVIPEIYQVLKAYGSKVVETPFDPSEDFLNDEDAKEVVDAVYNKYKNLSGGQLIHLTHRSNTPWSISYLPGKNKQIDNEKIKAHYKGILDRVS